MADNTRLNEGVGGDIIATDDIGGIKHQWVKLEYGADGSATPVSDSNALPVNSFDEEFTAAYTGLVRGKTAKNVYLLGRRTTFNATTPFQDVTTYLVGGQNTLNAVAVGTTYFVVSTSVQDLVGGTGISKVRIVYLDASGNQQVVSATLTGTTKVSIGSGFTAFQWMESSELGGASSATAVGNIAIFSGAGAAAAENTTVEQILAGGNRSLSGRYTIPTGYIGYLRTLYVSAAGSQAMDVRVRADCFADDRTISAGIFHFQDTAFLASGDSITKDLSHQKIPAGSMVKISVFPAATTGTPRCDVNLGLIIIAI